MTNQREKFEKECRSRYDLTRYLDGYADVAANHAWEGWKLALQSAAPASQNPSESSHERMSLAACEALGEIHDALGLDPDDAAGAGPILHAIAELKEKLKRPPEQAMQDSKNKPDAELDRLQNEDEKWSAGWTIIRNELARANRETANLTEMLQAAYEVPGVIPHVASRFSIGEDDVESIVSAQQAVQDKDAERYHWIRTRLGAVRHGSENPPQWSVKLPPCPDNVMRGSVAGHLDDAIDAAIEGIKKP